MASGDDLLCNFRKCRKRVNTFGWVSCSSVFLVMLMLLIFFQLNLCFMLDKQKFIRDFQPILFVFFCRLPHVHVSSNLFRNLFTFVRLVLDVVVVVVVVVVILDVVLLIIAYRLHCLTIKQISSVMKMELENFKRDTLVQHVSY